ncbi:hypothetical protein CYR52_04295 [Chimaeribacter arupi]|nr:hypothetical protein CYR52_04295 [Chimaeribacter arupi]
MPFFYAGDSGNISPFFARLLLVFSAFIRFFGYFQAEKLGLVCISPLFCNFSTTPVFFDYI